MLPFYEKNQEKYKLVSQYTSSDKAVNCKRLKILLYLMNYSLLTFVSCIHKSVFAREFYMPSPQQSAEPLA